MQKRLLKESVWIPGRDFFGRQSWLTIRPIGKAGLFWQYSCYEPPIQLSIDVLKYMYRRLTLVYDSRELHVIEHLAPLKWCGFNNLVFCSSPWPPYTGRTLEFYNSLLGKSTNGGNHKEWCTLSRKVEYRSGWRWMQIIPHDERRLDLTVVCRFKEYGQYAISLSFPAPESVMVKVLSTHTPGWPPQAYNLARLAGKLGWPHLNNIIWPQTTPEGLLEQFAYHRVLDLLGALAFVHPAKYFSGRVVSECCGHEQDLEILKRIQEYIVNLD